MYRVGLLLYVAHGVVHGYGMHFSVLMFEWEARFCPGCFLQGMFRYVQFEEEKRFGREPGGCEGEAGPGCLENRKRDYFPLEDLVTFFWVDTVMAGWRSDESMRANHGWIDECCVIKGYLERHYAFDTASYYR